jgi:hypothetical protein
MGERGFDLDPDCSGGRHRLIFALFSPLSVPPSQPNFAHGLMQSWAKLQILSRKK